jgi:hypothetical protein
MRTFTKYKWIFIALAQVAGCGDYSNPQLKEDLEFLSAIPAREVMELRVANQTPRQVGQQEQGLAIHQDSLLGVLATFYVETIRTTGEINRGVLGFLGIVDLITHFVPPTLRAEGRRVWGPWPSEEDPGVDLRFEMLKLEPGRFSLHYQLRRSELAGGNGFDEGWTDCVSGDVSPRGLFRRGEGDLLVDLDACASVTGSGEEGSALVDFDTTPDAGSPNGKTHVSIEFAGFLSREAIAAGEPATSANYEYSEAGDTSGWFDFTTWSDLHAESDPLKPALETFQWRVRWTSDGCGRADASVSGGDLGQLQILVSECWDAEHKRTYYTDNALMAPTEGDPADCCLPGEFD